MEETEGGIKLATFRIPLPTFSPHIPFPDIVTNPSLHDVPLSCEYPTKPQDVGYEWEVCVKDPAEQGKRRCGVSNVVRGSELYIHEIFQKETIRGFVRGLWQKVGGWVTGLTCRAFNRENPTHTFEVTEEIRIVAKTGHYCSVSEHVTPFHSLCKKNDAPFAMTFLVLLFVPTR